MKGFVPKKSMHKRGQLPAFVLSVSTDHSFLPALNVSHSATVFSKSQKQTEFKWENLGGRFIFSRVEQVSASFLKLTVNIRFPRAAHGIQWFTTMIYCSQLYDKNAECENLIVAKKNQRANLLNMGKVYQVDIFSGNASILLNFEHGVEQQFEGLRLKSRTHSFSINSVELTINKFEIMKSIYKYVGHKLVMLINDVYFGRSNLTIELGENQDDLMETVLTEETAKVVRRYIWSTAPSTKIYKLGHSSILDEYLIDQNSRIDKEFVLAYLHKKLPARLAYKITTRRGETAANVQVPVYTPDSVGIKNCNYCLPIDVLSDSDDLTVCFCNMRFDPPRHFIVVITWEQFMKELDQVFEFKLKAMTASPRTILSPRPIKSPRAMKSPRVHSSVDPSPRTLSRQMSAFRIKDPARGLTSQRSMLSLRDVKEPVRLCSAVMIKIASDVILSVGFDCKDDCDNVDDVSVITLRRIELLCEDYSVSLKNMFPSSLKINK